MWHDAWCLPDSFWILNCRSMHHINITFYRVLMKLITHAFAWNLHIITSYPLWPLFLMQTIKPFSDTASSDCIVTLIHCLYHHKGWDEALSVSLSARRNLKSLMLIVTGRDTGTLSPGHSELTGRRLLNVAAGQPGDSQQWAQRVRPARGKLNMCIFARC